MDLEVYMVNASRERNVLSCSISLVTTCLIWLHMMTIIRERLLMTRWRWHLKRSGHIFQRWIY